MPQAPILGNSGGFGQVLVHTLAVLVTAGETVHGPAVPVVDGLGELFLERVLEKAKTKVRDLTAGRCVCGRPALILERCRHCCREDREHVDDAPARAEGVLEDAEEAPFLR